jgi:hypothetical protein
MNGQGNARVRREAKRRGPLVNENTKKALFMKGPKTSDVVVHAMKDLHTLKAHDGKLFSRKNDIRPFEDTQSLEFLCHKNDTSLFCVASHTKKRPMTLTLGRLFNWSVLDMFEVSLTQYVVDRVRRHTAHSGPWLNDQQNTAASASVVLLPAQTGLLYFLALQWLVRVPPPPRECNRAHS